MGQHAALFALTNSMVTATLGFCSAIRQTIVTLAGSYLKNNVCFFRLTSRNWCFEKLREEKMGETALVGGSAHLLLSDDRRNPSQHLLD